MAKQVQVWQTERGEPASSELDALLGDAGDALADYADENSSQLHQFDFDLGDWLRENCDRLLPLLRAYAAAKAARRDEMMGART